MADEGLIQRVLGQQPAKLTNQVGVPAKLQFAFDALANCSAAFLLEAAAHPGHPVAADPGQRLATPQPVRLAQEPDRVIMIAGRDQGIRAPIRSFYAAVFDRDPSDEECDVLDHAFHTYYLLYEKEAALSSGLPHLFRQWHGAAGHTQSLLPLHPHDKLAPAVEQHRLTPCFALVQARHSRIRGVRPHLADHLASRTRQLRTGGMHLRMGPLQSSAGPLRERRARRPKPGRRAAHRPGPRRSARPGGADGLIALNRVTTRQLNRTVRWRRRGRGGR